MAENVKCPGSHCHPAAASGKYGPARDALPPHTCPYSEDVDNDHRTLCTCCDRCSDECAADI